MNIVCYTQYICISIVNELRLYISIIGSVKSRQIVIANWNSRVVAKAKSKKIISFPKKWKLRHSFSCLVNQAPVASLALVINI